MASPTPWRLWALTDEMTDAKVSDRSGRTYWRHKTTGFWWSKDTAGHGGAAFKVFERFGNQLHWKADADQYGNFIHGKHKSQAGTIIYLSAVFALLASGS